jgi:hypothetical protein
MKTQLDLMQTTLSLLLNREGVTPKNMRMRNFFVVLILLIICSTNTVYGQWLTIGEVPQSPCTPDKPFECIVRVNGELRDRFVKETDISGTINPSPGLVITTSCSRCQTSPAYNYT